MRTVAFLHVEIEKLLAQMQRHGVQVDRIDVVRRAIFAELEAAERRLEAARPVDELSVTRPDTPSSITSRLRALVDVDPDDDAG